MSIRNAQGYLNQNIHTIKQEAVNDLKVIWRSTLTPDSTVQTLETDLAAILAAGKGKPKAASFAVMSSNTTDIVARYTQDGTDPVATTTGDPLYDRDKQEISEYYNLQRFRITEEASNTTTIEVTYYK